METMNNCGSDTLAKPDTRKNAPRNHRVGRSIERLRPWAVIFDRAVILESAESTQPEPVRVDGIEKEAENQRR